MYNTFMVPISDKTEEEYKALVADAHPGVQYIKILSLLPTKDKASDISPGAWLWLKFFLEKLAVGQLEDI